MLELAFKREVIVNKSLCRAIGACAFIIFTALGAFVRIPLPFTPVPLTLQTFFVLLGAALLGAKLGAFTQAGYLFLGACGLPVFTASGSGPLYFSGPTTGYLFGFILASLFAGRFIEKSRDNLFLVLTLLFVADIILLSCGAIWLKSIFKLSLAEAFFLGFLPFIPGDLLKALAASVIYLRLKPRARNIFS